MTIIVEGKWHKGLAFDVHTLSSTYLGPDEYGHDRWDNTRSEMGELVYRLKYQGDKSVLPSIVALLEKIKGVEKFNYIIPIPPTDKSRAFQPVTEIAAALGKHSNVELMLDALNKKIGGPQLKNVSDPEERTRLLRETLCWNGDNKIEGKDVLLVDDLYRSGATLNVATDILYQDAKANRVAVLTMTKTRSTR